MAKFTDKNVLRVKKSGTEKNKQTKSQQTILQILKKKL